MPRLVAQCLTLVLFVTLSQALPKGAVLDSEVVDVEEVTSLKRSEGEREYKLTAFGKLIDLKLTKSRDLLPDNLLVLVYGEDGDGNPTLDDWTHRTDGSQSIYSDRTSGASLLVTDVFGETKLSGMLGDNLVIEPVEDITINSDDVVEKRELTRKLRHVVYKVKPVKAEATTDDYIVLPVEKSTSETREKRALPHTIYIPVHVVVDYSLWKKLDRSEAEVIEYMKVFYNAVNDLYSTISQPSVSVSIQGITICKSASACDMVENHRLRSDAVNAKTSLDAISNYAYSQRGNTGTDYALMMVMTDYDLCSPKGTTCERNTAGLAYVGTVCDTYRSPKTSKTGIAEDHGAFDGVKTVAHEMGHILGMNHDGDGEASRGAPGARSCDWNDNYIMGQVSFVENQFKWSPCSVDQLRWTVQQPSASCLSQKPSSAPYPLVNKLPGKVLDLDNQCKIQYGPTSGVGCKLPGVNGPNHEICLGLMCKTSSSGCNSNVPAAEGSYCGPQRYCRQGKCVCDSTAPFPTPPPEDPSCTADNARIRISGKGCVDLLTGAGALDRYCDSGAVKQYCCKSRTKYCRADPIKCDGSSLPVTTPGTFNPSTRARVTTTPRPLTSTTRRPDPGQTDNCGNACADTPRILINGEPCADLLSSSSKKRTYCDDPTAIEHCCATRNQVCAGYHWITESCDVTCQDNPGMRINGEHCVPFLSSSSNLVFCNHSLITGNCCASRRKYCTSTSSFGK